MFFHQTYLTQVYIIPMSMETSSTAVEPYDIHDKILKQIL